MIFSKSSKISSRLIHIVHGSVLHYLLLPDNTPLYGHATTFYLSMGQLFHFSCIMNNAAMKTLVQVFGWMHIFFLNFLLTHIFNYLGWGGGVKMVEIEDPKLVLPFKHS